MLVSWSFTCCGFGCRQLGQSTAAELDTALISTAGHALTVSQLWQQQHPQQTASSSSTTGVGVQQGQQLPTLMESTYWQPSFDLLVECLLLAPTPGMARSCLPLMTLLLLQPHGSGSKNARNYAEATISLINRAALTDVPAAVHFCMQQTASLKQAPAAAAAVGQAADDADARGRCVIHTAVRVFQRASDTGVVAQPILS
jgi:hypothetical protein